MRCFEKLNKTVLGFGIAVALTILLLSEPALAAQKSDSPTSAKDFLRLGVGALRQNNYPAAIENFTQAIQRDKQYAPAYANRCLAHLQQDNNQSAEPNCTQALQLNPDNTEAYLNRGLARYRLGEYQQAIADCNALVKLKPDEFRAYYNRGLAHAALGEYEQAIADYNQSLHQGSLPEPNLAMIHNNRGVAQLKLNHLQNAISDFNQALQFHAANVGALYNRGRVFRQQGDYTSALQDFTQVIQLVPNYAPAYLNRGLLRHQVASSPTRFSSSDRGFAKSSRMLLCPRSHECLSANALTDSTN